jgi:16S rRNA (guanine527-N7)-methyltransferase
MTTSDLLQCLTARASRAGIEIRPTDADRLVAYYELLERWNRTINLTSLRDRDGAMDRLLIEPVAASAFLPLNPQLMDIGSGGGSPAIPLAIALNATSLVMVESHGRKSAFLREAARQLMLPSVLVHNGRFEALEAESLGDKRPNVISVRAVRINVDLLRDVKRFLTPAGQLALFSTQTSIANLLAVGLHVHSTHPLPSGAALLLGSDPNNLPADVPRGTFKP